MKYIFKPLFLIVTICLFSFTNERSCTKDQKISDEFNYLIPFEENDMSLNSSAQVMIDDFVKLMEKDSCTEQSLIFIYTKSFEEELQRNSYIGVNRAKVVVDYFEKNYKIRRSRCFIVDNAPRYLTIKGKPGVTLIYRKKGL